MNIHPILRQFNRWFKIHLVDNETLKHAAYRIRYQVYCEEMGWEAKNDHKLESDQYDEYSLHCLVEHRKSGTFAGCARLVMPCSSSMIQKLPIEREHLHSIRHVNHKPLTTRQHRFGEISRIAVLPCFRRRKSEHYSPKTCLNTRNNPNISLGLILAISALADIHQLTGVYMLSEPRLKTHLQKRGLHFEQVGHPVYHRGKRAIYYLPLQAFYQPIDQGVKSLYQFIHNEISDNWQAMAI